MERGWDQALDAMRDLAHAYKTAEYQQYLQGFAESLASGGKSFDRNTLEVLTEPADQQHREHIHGLITVALATCERGEPVWVSEDVCELIDVAAEHPTFEVTPVWLDELFVREAWVLLGRPMEQPDLRGKRFVYRALSWAIVMNGEVEEGVVLCKWSHKDDSDDYYDARTGMRRLYSPDGSEVIEERHVPGRLIGGTPYTLAHVGFIPFGNESILQEPVNRRMIAMFEAMWRLAQQELVLAGRERVSRPTWKRAATWRQIKEVTILRLRKAKYQTKYEGEREVEWSHRWIVSGHWRNQPYKVDGEWRKKQIWIEPFEKGPPDKPLIVKKHAVEFTR